MSSEEEVKIVKGKKLSVFFLFFFFFRNLPSDVLLLAPSPSAPSAKIVKVILRWLSLKHRHARGSFLGFVYYFCLILSSSRRVTTTLSANKATPCVDLLLVFYCYTHMIAGVGRKLHLIGLLILMLIVILSKFLLF